VCFRACTGKCVALDFFELDPIPEASRDSLKAIALSRANPVSPVVPAIPAMVPLTFSEGAISAWPVELRGPLVKCTEDEDTAAPKGRASGVRSAVIKCGQEWFRLKGCGNQDQGFVLRPVDVNPLLWTVRGCAFQHTARLETAMTALISKLLLEADAPLPANEPMGWIEYGVSESPVPEIIPYCGVFRTFGDRRLGDHLLQGLEMLIPFLDLSRVTLDLSVLPRERVDKDSIVPTWFAVLDDLPFFATENLTLSLRQDLSVGDLLGVSDDCKSLLLELLNAVSQEDYDLGRNLTALYRRLGFECGLVLRCLHQNHVSWGTYADHMGTHCNAHANNMAIIAPFRNSKWLLGPLDFDMAFTEKIYLNLASGLSDSPYFQENLRLERQGFRMTLAGDDKINSGVIGNVPLTESFLNLKWALRDVLIIGFEDGMNGKSIEFASSSMEDFKLLIEIALCLTSSIQA